jgi:diaminopropionate ammonia-lyase
VNRFFLNNNKRREHYSELFDSSTYQDVKAFFLSRAKSFATPLVSLPALAAKFGVAEVLVKDESLRALNAFKVLGVSYAMEQLKRGGKLDNCPTLVCATDGNHGRAVAYAAREYGLQARVYVPAYTVQARIRALVDQGAEVVVVAESYDDAVRQAALDAEQQNCLLISDTSWAGYEEIPRLIMAGYSQVMNEASQQWKTRPSVVFLQVGVGGFAGAIASWLSFHYGAGRPLTVACEPVQAACLLHSLLANKTVSLTGNLPTVMAGLRCGEVSKVAWPVLAGTIDASVAIEDRYAEDAVRLFGHPYVGDAPITAGESGACGLATLHSILVDPVLEPVKRACNLGPSSRVLIFNTEGATDPEYHARIAG